MDRLVHSLRVENHSTVVSRLMCFARAAFSFLGKSKEDQLGKAVLRGSRPRVRELLQSGANPNAAMLTARGPRGRKTRGTPLMAAASEGLTEIVAELLAHGACVDQTDERGWTALLCAAENGYETICRLLMDHGADPNVRCVQSGTALMAAALKGHAGVVRVLLERSADPSVRDSIGKSALDFARKYGRSDVVSILTKHGQARS
jgi:ankyrin repeat protein